MAHSEFSMWGEGLGGDTEVLSLGSLQSTVMITDAFSCLIPQSCLCKDVCVGVDRGYFQMCRGLSTCDSHSLTLKCTVSHLPFITRCIWKLKMAKGVA